jgi:hypothetical protein
MHHPMHPCNESSPFHYEHEFDTYLRTHGGTPAGQIAIPSWSIPVAMLFLAVATLISMVPAAVAPIVFVFVFSTGIVASILCFAQGVDALTLPPMVVQTWSWPDIQASAQSAISPAVANASSTVAEVAHAQLTSTSPTSMGDIAVFTIGVALLYCAARSYMTTDPRERKPGCARGRECYASNIPFLPEVRSFLANCMLRLVYPHKCGGWNLNPCHTARGYRLQIFAIHMLSFVTESHAARTKGYAIDTLCGGSLSLCCGPAAMAAAMAAVAGLAAHHAARRATTAIASAEQVKAAKAAAAQALTDSHAYMRNRLSFPSGEHAAIGVAYAESAIGLIEKSLDSNDAANKSRIRMLTCIYSLLCTYIRVEIGEGRRHCRAKGSKQGRSEKGKPYRYLPDRFPDMNEWITNADGSGRQPDSVGFLNAIRALSKPESTWRPCVKEAKQFIALLDEVERDLITLRSLQHTLARMRGMHPPPHVPLHRYITLSATRADSEHADNMTTEYHLEVSTIHIYTGSDSHIDYWRHRADLQRPPLATVRLAGSKRTLMMTSLLSIVAPVESKATELITASGMISAVTWITAAVTILLLLALLHYCWRSYVTTVPFEYVDAQTAFERQMAPPAYPDTQAVIQMAQNMARPSGTPATTQTDRRRDGSSARGCGGTSGGR